MPHNRRPSDFKSMTANAIRAIRLIGLVINPLHA
jgi:hypothetical protein